MSEREREESTSWCKVRSKRLRDQRPHRMEDKEDVAMTPMKSTMAS